jgi:hypothetical protein
MWYTNLAKDNPAPRDTLLWTLWKPALVRRRRQRMTHQAGYWIMQGRRRARSRFLPQLQLTLDPLRSLI